MKKLANIVAIAGLVGTPAFAADLPVKAPPPPPAPIYSWTGFYVGGNVGYSWGNAHTDLTGLASTTFVGVFPSEFGFGDSQHNG